jgi:hypothetical protein
VHGSDPLRVAIPAKCGENYHVGNRAVKTTWMGISLILSQAERDAVLGDGCLRLSLKALAKAITLSLQEEDHQRVNPLIE